MKPEQVRQFLNDKGVQFEEKEVQNGTQFRCQEGEIFVVYTTGTLNVQGRPTNLSTQVRSLQPLPRAVMPAGASPDTNIFVVYGHDVAARKELELLLHRMGL